MTGKLEKCSLQSPQWIIKEQTGRNAACGGTQCTEEHQWTQGWARTAQVALLPSAGG